MASDSIDDLLDRAQANWEDVGNYTADAVGWGFFSYSEEAPSVGGGVGMFTCFQTVIPCLTSLWRPCLTPLLTLGY